jgi:hypothetical protein
VDEKQDRGGREVKGHGVAMQAGPVALGAPEDSDLGSVERFLENRRAERWAGGEPLRPGASVTRTIARFSPRDVAPEVWRRVEPLVKEAVTKAAPGDPQKANHTLSIVTQLAVWADRIGRSLEPESLFDPEFIDRFIDEGCAHLSDGSQLNYRTALWRVGEAVLGVALFPPKPLPLQRSKVDDPYSPGAVTEFVSWSRGLPTSHMRRNSWALLALGLGAGLSSQEITSLVGTDVRTEDGIVLIDVEGKRARTVPVNRHWAKEVATLAAESGPRPFYMPERARITRRDILGFIERCTGEGEPKFNVQRLRITWIVGQLAAGTHPTALVRAAGVGIGQIGKYLVFVPEVDQHTYRTQVSGQT